jgi:hypothetical protein
LKENLLIPIEHLILNIRMKKLFSILLILFFASGGAFSQAGPQPGAPQYIKSLLNHVNSDGTTVLLDGDLTQYSPSYSDSVNGQDARKMDNPGENIGMQRANTMLAIERRQVIAGADSIFYRIWNLSQNSNYQLQLITTNLNQPGLIGYLVDSYLKINRPVDLNGTTNINFSIDGNPASYDISRFTLIYATTLNTPLPLTFISENANVEDNLVKVYWQTANENNIKQYALEKSGDGNNFSSIGNILAGNLSVNKYSFTDNYPVNGYNYYRIKSEDSDSNLKYSEVMKIFVGKGSGTVKVFPNPLIDNSINLEMVNQPADTYQVRVRNEFGQVVISKKIQYTGGSVTQTLYMPQNIPHGIYQLVVSNAGKNVVTIGLIY